MHKLVSNTYPNAEIVSFNSKNWEYYSVPFVFNNPKKTNSSSVTKKPGKNISELGQYFFNCFKIKLKKRNYWRKCIDFSNMFF